MTYAIRAKCSGRGISHPRDSSCGNAGMEPADQLAHTSIIYAYVALMQAPLAIGLAAGEYMPGLIHDHDRYGAQSAKPGRDHQIGHDHGRDAAKAGLTTQT
jgi:hypothetical protein